MAYIDYSYYFNDYKGVLIENDDAFSRLSERASDIIDQMTNGRIQDIGFDNLHERIKANVKKAVAAQVESMHLNGGVESIHGSSGVSSASIGNFSYSSGTSNESESSTSSAVVNYLRLTGLMYRGVNVCG